MAARKSTTNNAAAPAGPTPETYAELVDAIAAWRDTDERYRVIYDELMASRRRVTAALEALGVSRAGGWSS